MKKITWIILLATLCCSGQEINLSGGVSDVNHSFDGTVFNWNIGIAHSIEFPSYNRKVWNTVGFMASYGKVFVDNTAYRNADFFLTYGYEEGVYRFAIGPGLSYNVDDQELEFAAAMRNSFKIMPGVHIIFDFKNVFAERNTMHFSIGFSADVKFYNN